jgi:hypothetical protein
VGRASWVVGRASWVVGRVSCVVRRGSWVVRTVLGVLMVGRRIDNENIFLKAKVKVILYYAFT